MYTVKKKMKASFMALNVFITYVMILLSPQLGFQPISFVAELNFQTPTENVLVRPTQKYQNSRQLCS